MDFISLLHLRLALLYCREFSITLQVKNVTIEHAN